MIYPFFCQPGLAAILILPTIPFFSIVGSNLMFARFSSLYGKGTGAKKRKKIFMKKAYPHTTVFLPGI
jgi:hypothetical protein